MIFDNLSSHHMRRFQSCTMWAMPWAMSVSQTQCCQHFPCDCTWTYINAVIHSSTLSLLPYFRFALKLFRLIRNSLIYNSAAADSASVKRATVAPTSTITRWWWCCEHIASCNTKWLLAAVAVTTTTKPSTTTTEEQRCWAGQPDHHLHCDFVVILHKFSLIFLQVDTFTIRLIIWSEAAADDESLQFFCNRCSFSSTGTQLSNDDLNNLLLEQLLCCGSVSKNWGVNTVPSGRHTVR